ncbi:MAG: LTA synthase family protein, partial [Paramuribaculum sp.]|nr:LTA synthase family protein [Paramuribaculum sp.]
LGIRPNNPSIVYFHSDNFFNHWALNPAYNLVYSLSARDDYAGQFRFMPSDECDRLVSRLFPKEGKSESHLLTRRPDILVIVWESFGAEFCEPLGGRSGVTPNFNRLCEEGLFFTRCRASSFRTDRALPAIFCGLPGQPTATIVRHTRKLPCLPALARDLRENGYLTMAVHGGDLAIMHKSDFYLSAGNSTLIAQRDFPGNPDHGKWGVHDLPVFERVADEAARLTGSGQKWMISVQSLSSHEPFNVPYDRLHDPADNSMAYTDHALGRMVERLKASGVWDNLLMVVVADHGLNRSDTPSQRDVYSHIPLLFAGGAVGRPERIDSIMSQTDIASTLLGQLGLHNRNYPFSRDVLADT